MRLKKGHTERGRDGVSKMSRLFFIGILWWISLTGSAPVLNI